MSPRLVLRFAAFELDSTAGELRQRGDLIKLPPQPFRVLELLVSRSGEVITRDQLRDHVWNEDTVVDFEQGLNFCIRRIREVLGDTAESPRFIETLPRRGYRFLLPVTGSESAPTRATRLIVIPFRMLRPDPETEYLAFSLPDALTSSLGELQSLVVRSSMAAARFAGEAVEPDRIRTEADVDLIVTGTLLRSGPEVRVVTQLTDAASGALLWSHTAQAPVGDVFRVQDELAQRIVESLALPLSGREQRLLHRDAPSSARAYEYFLRGNQLSYDAKQWGVARDLYLRCVEEDANFAPAWARLGRIHHVMGKYLPSEPGESLRLADEAFRRALELRPDLTLTHKLYAQLEVDEGRAHDAMARLTARARTADPELLAGLVTTCRYCGLLDASLAAHSRALELEPKIRTSVAHTWFVQGDFARLASLSMAEYPYIVSLALGELGRAGEAISALRDLEGKTPTRLRDFMIAARTMLEGDQAESVATLRRIATSNFRDPEPQYYLSRQLAHLDEEDFAVELLERAVDGGYFCYPAMASDPWLDSLRRKPTFTKVMRRAQTQHRNASADFERLGGDRVLGSASSF